MKEVIFCNSVGALRSILRDNDDKGKVHYLPVDYSVETAKVMRFLKERSNFLEVKQDSSGSGETSFQDKFVNFIADLNEKNQSWLWWCLNFTNKNPISTSLCSEAFHLLNIVKAASASGIDKLLVITKNRDIAKQFFLYSRGKSIKVTYAIGWGRFSARHFLLKYTPSGSVYAFLRMFFCAVYAKVNFPVKFKTDKKRNVVFSILSPQSFKKDGSYSDVYFGRFIEYLREKKYDFINLVTVRPAFYRRLLKKVRTEVSDVPIFPVERFLTIGDLVRCFFISISKYFSPIRLSGSTKIDGVDIARLIKKNIRYDYMTPFFFDNLKVYFAVKKLARKMRIARFFYPFENRPFEKMAILALREASPETHITGYQHASISLRHTNFLLGRSESSFTPLPDSIITMGEATKDILMNKGNFPQEIIKVGCALRQAPFSGKAKKRKEKIRNLFVALATNIEEYVKVIDFLNEASIDSSGYELWIRPHPVFSLEEAIKITGTPRFTFHKADKESLEECYSWADAILYVHSTLAIESIMRGIPVINLGVQNPLDPDPLFDFNEYKWRVDSPGLLISAIRGIDSLTNEEYIRRQLSALEYAKRYLCETRETAMQSFIC